MVALTLAAAACERGASPGTLARAGGHELSVAQAAALLAPEATLPNRAEVVTAVADLWIDYTLLATAASADSTLQKVDLKPIVEQQEEVEMIGLLRDKAVQLDTAISDEEVRAAFAQKGPGVRVRARHILLSPPEGATPSQRDSVKEAANKLLQRVRAGEKFDELARQHSQDPGSAARGGDLGFFERGQMVAAFDSAAFALQPGQISDLVATPFGYHIIKVEERQAPSLEEIGPQFRQQLQGEKVMKAESTFVSGLETKSNMKTAEGAAGLVREVAKNPMARMGGRALRRELVTYDGGGLTVDDVRQFLQTREPAFREQVGQATDQQIEQNLLTALTQRELLVAEAKKQGITPNRAHQDSMLTLVRTSFLDAARQLGLVGIKPNDGENQKQAIDRTVSALLTAILKGERNVIPLGAVAFTLRRQYPAEINQESVAQVVTQVEGLRGPAAAPGAMPPMPGMDSAAGASAAPTAPPGAPR